MFLDTNVLVYLFDADTPQKQRRARDIFSDEEYLRRIFTSTQVLQEFYVSVTRKLARPLEPEKAYRAVKDLSSLPVIQIDPPLILTAIQRSQKDQLSFWDGLIVQAALSGGAKHLFSEDLQDGREIEGMRIENPFS